MRREEEERREVEEGEYVPNENLRVDIKGGVRRNRREEEEEEDGGGGGGRERRREREEEEERGGGICSQPEF